MPHFFVPSNQIRNGRFALAPEESAHVARVLRKKPGEEIGLFDGVDHAYHGILETVTLERVEGRIVKEFAQIPRRYTLRLFQALPKGDAFEWVLEKATELGVSEIVPLLTRRGVAKVPADRVAAKRARWDKIVRAASAQCGRADVPRVGAPCHFESALSDLKQGETTLIPWEGESDLTLRQALGSVERKGRPPVLNVMIGPEGGFDPEEVARARAAGATAVTLGPRILRTETAGLVVASALLYEFEL